ncbi:MAG: hypothetical protein LBG06_06575 [Deltaproteobacteria bacterium]|jgi:hypothetical protein|nr:hypothetical protein [Deltaproteobacteria bacterium]
MKTALKLAVSVALSLALAACGDAKLDTADAESFTSSIRKMYDSAQDAEREDFRRFFFIAMNGRSDLITMSVLNGEEIERLGSFYSVLVSRKRPEDLAALDGLTVQEIIELGRGLKITYIEGRLQELQREMDQLKDQAEFYRDYSAQRELVQATLSDAAEPSRGPSGKTAEATVTVTVHNGSELPVVDLQCASAVEPPRQLEISLGESRALADLPGEGFLDEAGGKVFPSPGVPAGDDKTLHATADVSSMEWPYPPEMPLKAALPGGVLVCLEGWERFFEAEDSYRRVVELERTHSLLTRDLSETRV